MDSQAFESLLVSSALPRPDQLDKFLHAASHAQKDEIIRVLFEMRLEKAKRSDEDNEMLSRLVATTSWTPSG